MCNINLIYNRKGKNDGQLLKAINIMSYESFKNNDDGQGFLGLQKDKEKQGINFKLERSLNNMLFNFPSFLVCSHQRYATSGSKDIKGNTQPLETNDFIMLHNGVIYGLGDEQKSDTHHLILKFQELYLELKSEVKVIKKLFENDIKGSYSILLFNKNSKKLFYFKNSKTNFYGVMDKKYIALSTKKGNCEFAKEVLDINGKVEEIQDGIIFNVLQGFKKIATFTPIIETEYKYSWEKETKPIKESVILPSNTFQYEEDFDFEKHNQAIYFQEHYAEIKEFIETYYDAKVFNINSDGVVKLSISADIYPYFKDEIKPISTKTEGKNIIMEADAFNIMALKDTIYRQNRRTQYGY